MSLVAPQRSSASSFVASTITTQILTQTIVTNHLGNVDSFLGLSVAVQSLVVESACHHLREAVAFDFDRSLLDRLSSNLPSVKEGKSEAGWRLQIVALSLIWNRFVQNQEEPLVSKRGTSSVPPPQSRGNTLGLPISRRPDESLAGMRVGPEFWDHFSQSTRRGLRSLLFEAPGKLGEISNTESKNAQFMIEACVHWLKQAYQLIAATAPKPRDRSQIEDYLSMATDLLQTLSKNDIFTSSHGQAFWEMVAVSKELRQAISLVETIKEKLEAENVKKVDQTLMDVNCGSIRWCVDQYPALNNVHQVSGSDKVGGGRAGAEVARVSANYLNDTQVAHLLETQLRVLAGKHYGGSRDYVFCFAIAMGVQMVELPQIFRNLFGK